MRRDDLLTMLLYGLEIAIRPNVGAMIQTGSLSRSCGRRYGSQLHKLQESGLVEQRETKDEWVVALTRNGRLRALGGREPDEEWERPWDKVWRVAMFDIGSHGTAALRRRLLRTLHRLHFGCLQKSVWLRPMPCPEFASVLDEIGASSSSILLFEGRPASRLGPDSNLVRAAWNFDEINAAYEQYLAFANLSLPKKPTSSEALGWAENEARLWKNAVWLDPMLPNILLPRDYLGKKAWARRRKLLRRVGSLTAALGSSS